MMAEAGAAGAAARANKPALLRWQSLFLLLQVAVLVGAWALLTRQGCGAGQRPRLAAPRMGGSDGDDGSADIGAAAAPVAGLVPYTSNLSEWAAAADKLAFLAPQSRCLLDPTGTVYLREWQQPGAPPFLFDTASMPLEAEVCGHCPQEHPKFPVCCGVCVFARRKCDDFYPGQNRSEQVLGHLLSRGFRLRDFSPCELFARIRGRTLWLMGDSQMWNMYYAVECLLREFAPALRRTRAVANATEEAKLVTVTAPAPYHTMCLELALGTRVCAVRVDLIRDMREVVIPVLQANRANFSQDLVLFNFGLHYQPPPGRNGRPANESQLWHGLLALAQWRAQHIKELPAMVWMDTPVQHFSTPDGSWPGGDKPFKCSPLKAWFDGDPLALAGGPFNAPIAPLVPHIADGHLRTWNATVTLWHSHWPEECSHWCHPSAYQLWVHLFNNVLRDRQLGNPVQVPERS